jgi:alkanesulfonate monooxygenase SsuD/methylene tetrahydromethanopterin reductase-like flavin-dependent oxidoreductase (luciferase family)
MNIGFFQLLPRPASRTDREVVEQALAEVDFAERQGFESVWVAEHHLSDFGLVGAPSVYAAAIAARTRRIRIGYGVAVVPLHQPLRLAEEIAWLQELSDGRVFVGVGPGFSPYELGAFGVPLEVRHARLEEGLAIVRRALKGDGFSARPHPRTMPPILRAASSDESVRIAAAEGTQLMLGLKPFDELASRLELYRSVAGTAAEASVLRRIVVAPTDEEAIASMRGPLLWEHDIATRVHEGLADGSHVDADALVRHALRSACCGSPATVARQLRNLQDLGVQRVIGWFHFGDMPYETVMRSMELLATEVLPALREEEPVTPSHSSHAISTRFQPIAPDGHAS